MVRIEADALRALADRLAGPMAADFERAVELLYSCAGRIVVTGMGKSGLIARKIAATLTSTGSPALFLHPAEALHGDLGMVVRGDVVVALSASGETGEILQLLATVKRLGVPLITMTCDDLHSTSEEPRSRSTLAQAADVALDCSVAHEACSLGLAPTASTTTMLASGRRACRRALRTSRLQGGRLRQPASRWKTGQAIRARLLAHAHRRRCPAGEVPRPL